MKIENNGSAWLGTFGIALTKIATDVLADNEPVEVNITFTTYGGTEHDVNDSLVGVDVPGHSLLLECGVAVDIDSVLSFELVD